MKPSEITPETRANEKAFRLVSSLLTAAMLACAAATLVSVLTRVLIGWQPWYLVGFCFLVALDSLYNYGKFKKIDLFSPEWLQAAGTQVVILLVALRVVIGLSHGLAAFGRELTSGWFAFLTSFLSVEYLIGFGMSVVTWLVSLGFAGLFDEMGLDAELIRMEGYAVNPAETRPPRERLVSLVMSVGTVLVFFTALMRLDFRAALGGVWADAVLDVPPLSNGGASTLLYFLLALALFSQTQFIDLHNRWSINRVPVDTAIVGRWAFYSLGFLVLVACLASLLPTSYSLGLLASLGYALDWVAYLLFAFVQVLVVVVLFLLGLLAMLFGREAPAETPEMPSFQPQFLPPAPVDAASAPLPWLEVAKSLLFWGLFIAVLLFALVQYLRQHEEVIAALRKRPSLAWLGRLWDWLRGAWQAAQKGIVDAVSAGLERIRPRQNLVQAVGGWINLRKLGPRQRVFFFYQAFLRRSGESGLPRSLSQTPLEFASRLDRALPEAEPDIEALTGAFIEARYTPRPVEPEKASRAKEVWEHLRKALRGKKAENGK
jgi:hypothetical protein